MHQERADQHKPSAMRPNPLSSLGCWFSPIKPRFPSRTPAPGPARSAAGPGPPRTHLAVPTGPSQASAVSSRSATRLRAAYSLPDGRDRSEE